MRYIIAVYPYGDTAIGNGDVDFVEFEGNLMDAEAFVSVWWNQSHEPSHIAWTVMPLNQVACFKLKKRAPDPMEKYEKVK